MYVKVAVPRPVDSFFDYEYDESLGPIEPGQLVSVPFGKSKLNATVIEVSETRPALPEGVKMRKVTAKLSDEFSITPDILKLCRFGADYYQYPIGEAFFVATPPKPEKILSTRGESKAVPKAEKKLVVKQLTEEQEKALKFIREGTEKEPHSVYLLEGVTGSGKTEVYIELAGDALKKNRGVLIMVPEIALTSHLKDRFEKALGVKIALWHSALADGLRQTQWRKVKTGEIKVIVGARSAVFAPFQDLGLIVIDEEHDQTYKQEERFRYQARDLAIYRAKLLGIPIVLGSATPSFETLQRVQEGKVHRVAIKNRYSTQPLPEVEFVSLIEEPLIYHEAIKTPLAEKTVRRMQEAIDRGEQVIVFLNRRGFSQFILCKDCGWIKKCDQCSISMTHYQRRNELRCHVCGVKAKVPDRCESCLSHDLEGMGSGTESLEDELKVVLTDAKILRLDRDQITSQKRLDETLDGFRNLEANVLIGTQMLVKGHDFPKVTCVVVMLVDMLLKWPDFRASERALQTLIQISGRSGRAELPGRVVIQGYDLEHPVVKVLKGEIDRKTLIDEEVELRRALFYPPFSRFVRYRFEGVDAGKLKNQVESLVARVREQPLIRDGLEARIMGPSEALLFRAQGLYRFDVYFKAPQVDALLRVSHLVRKLALQMEIDLVVDVDPYSS